MTMNNAPVLAIVIPCFNETEVIEATAARLGEVLGASISAGAISRDSFLLFVDDGSRDATWAKLTKICEAAEHVRALKLARNYGHQNALLAGLNEVKDGADCVISIDADLQQDETAIPLFIEKFKNGSDIVLGIRTDREADSWFKKKTALLFYDFMQAMGVRIVKNHADYRLMSQRALNALMQYEETNLFLRGLILDIGFHVDTVPFAVKERFAGESKYSLGRMLGFALHGITSFSVVPLRLVSSLGLAVFAGSAIMAAYVLVKSLGGHTVPGWASIVLPIYFIGGLQIFCIGVVGEYIGHIYKEVKRRPRYIVDRRAS
jgi:polyisoprenyl-phosphate glycosyltransferase